MLPRGAQCELLTDRPRTHTLSFDTTSLLNQENKDKQRSQNILKTILPDAVRGCTKLRNEIETQRTKRNETKYTKMRNETQRNEIY